MRFVLMALANLDEILLSSSRHSYNGFSYKNERYSSEVVVTHVKLHFPVDHKYYPHRGV